MGSTPAIIESNAPCETMPEALYEVVSIVAYRLSDYRASIRLNNIIASLVRDVVFSGEEEKKPATRKGDQEEEESHRPTLDSQQVTFHDSLLHL